MLSGKFIIQTAKKLLLLCHTQNLFNEINEIQFNDYFLTCFKKKTGRVLKKKICGVSSSINESSYSIIMEKFQTNSQYIEIFLTIL